MNLKLTLSDADTKIVDAWKSQFGRLPEVEIRTEDLLQVPADAFLLPGNSFGFLDSGLELRIVETFGWEVQDEIRKKIRTEFDGELLVGQAVILRLPSLPRALVYAPIWRTPRPLAHTVNVFLAMRGAFIAIKKDATLQSLVVPGMGATGPHGIDPRISARQIRYAYEMANGQRGLGDKNLSQLHRREKKLQAIPGAEKEDADEA